MSLTHARSADFEILRRFCLRHLGFESVSLRQFYKLDSHVSSIALADVKIQLNCDVEFVQAPQKLTVCNAIAIGGGQHSTLVEMAAPLQEFYDIRIIQPAGAGQRAPLHILVQCKWSANPATSDSSLAKWLGTVQQCWQVRHFLHQHTFHLTTLPFWGVLLFVFVHRDSQFQVNCAPGLRGVCLCCSASLVHAARPHAVESSQCDCAGQ